MAVKELMAKHRKALGATVDEFDAERAQMHQKMDKLEVVQQKWAQSAVTTFFDRWLFITKIRLVRKKSRFDKINECNKIEKEFFDIQMRKLRTENYLQMKIDLGEKTTENLELYKALEEIKGKMNSLRTSR